MPQGVTDFGASAWLAALFAVTTAPSSYWLALVDGEPGVDSDGTILADMEPDGADYRRQRYGVGPDHWAVNGSYLVNLADVDFDVASTDWGYRDHFAICSAVTGGEIYAYGELSEPQFLEADSQLILPAGSLILALVPVNDAIVI